MTAYESSLYNLSLGCALGLGTPLPPQPEPEEPRDDAPEPPEYFSGGMTSAEEDARGYSPAVLRSWTNR